MLNYMARNPNGALRARASVHNTLGAAGEAGFTGYQAARAAHRVKQHRAGKENPRYKPEYAQYYDEKLPDKRKKTAVKKSIAALPPGTNSRKARRATNRYTTSRNKAYARGTRSTPGMPMSGKVVGSNVGPGSSNSLGHRIKRAKKRAGARAKIEYGMWSNPPQFESLPRASSSRSGFKVTNVPKMNKRKKKLIAIGAGVGAGAALGTGGYALYRNRQKKEPVRKALDLGMNFNPVGRNIEMYPVEDDDLEFQKSVHSAASKEHRRPEPFSAERKRLKRGRAYSNAAAIGGGAALVGSGAAGYKAYRSGKRAFQPGAIRTKQLAAASKPLGAAAGLGALGAAGLYGSKKISDKYRRGHAQSYR